MAGLSGRLPTSHDELDISGLDEIDRMLIGLPLSAAPFHDFSALHNFPKGARSRRGVKRNRATGRTQSTWTGKSDPRLERARRRENVQVIGERQTEDSSELPVKELRTIQKQATTQTSGAESTGAKAEEQLKGRRHIETKVSEATQAGTYVHWFVPVPLT